MITNKASLLTLCLIASSAIAQQDEQRTFMQRAKQKKDQLITHVKENKKAYAALGFSVTALIGLIGAAYKYDGFIDKLATSLQSLWPDNANHDVSDDENTVDDNTDNNDLEFVKKLNEEVLSDAIENKIETLESTSEFELSFSDIV